MRREEDSSVKSNSAVNLSWRRLSKSNPFRWLPSHGQPLSIGEWIFQNIVRVIAWLPVYVTLTIVAAVLMKFFVT